MKRILFIDYITKGEHADYNNIQLESLSKLGVKLDVCSHANSFNIDIFKKDINKFMEIPDVFYRRHRNILEYSYLIFKRLNLIKKIVSKSEYDSIIFSSYISTYQIFYKFDTQTFLVNHYNLAILDKRRITMLRYLANFNIFICLNKSISKYILDNFSIHSITVNHGLFCKNNSALKDLSFHKEYGNYIFMPASASLDCNLMEEIISSKYLNDFLQEHSMKLLIKDKFMSKNTNNIIKINKYLSHEEYHNLFYNAKAILLPYNKLFVNRVSATFIESITYNIPCFLSSRYLNEIYKEHLAYNAYFTNVEELISLLSKELITDDKQRCYYINRNIEKANWQFIVE